MSVQIRLGLRAAMTPLLLAQALFFGCTPDQYDYPVAIGRFEGEVWASGDQAETAIGSVTLETSSSTLIKRLEVVIDSTESAPGVVLVFENGDIGGLDARSFEMVGLGTSEGWSTSGAFQVAGGADIEDRASLGAGSVASGGESRYEYALELNLAQDLDEPQVRP